MATADGTTSTPIAQTAHTAGSPVTGMPAHGLSEQGARTLLEAAAAAPSLHNTQPWRFVLGSDGPGGSSQRPG